MNDRLDTYEREELGDNVFGLPELKEMTLAPKISCVSNVRTCLWHVSTGIVCNVLIINALVTRQLIRAEGTSVQTTSALYQNFSLS